MEEKSKVIFGNVMSDKVYKSAVKSKKKFIKKFGDDSNVDYPIYIQKNEHIGDSLGVYDILLKEGTARKNLIMKRVSLLGISVWDSAITVFLWQWHPLQKLWDIPRTGWISTAIHRPPVPR